MFEVAIFGFSPHSILGAGSPIARHPRSCPLNQTPKYRHVDDNEQPERTNAEFGGPEMAVVGFYKFVLVVATLGCLAQCLLMLVARLGDTIELASHFSMHSLVLSTVLLPVLYFARMRHTLWVAMAVTLILLPVVQPWRLLPIGETVNESFTQQYKVLSWNVLSSNYEFEKIDKIIADEDADILVLIEVREGFLEKLPSLSRYKSGLVHPSWRGGGIAVMTKQSDVPLALHEFDYPTQPAISVALEGDGRRMQLLAVHTFSPMPISRTPHRDRQLDSFVDWSLTQDQPVCMVGDLNITPWAPAFGRITSAGFNDSRNGVGNCASWPSALGFLGIPIDHALTKGECQVTDRRVLSEAPGSDHRGITFTVRF